MKSSVVQLRDQKNASKRRKRLSDAIGVTFDAIGETVFQEHHYKGHCENPIGAVQIPLGVAGPLEISNFKSRLLSFYIPLATTEGALIASVNRGCKAITLSGKAYVFAKSVGSSRGPVFRVSSVSAGRQLQKWIKKNEEVLNSVAKKTSGHIKLVHIKSRLIGRNLYVRFSFDTQDAMGMNMVTIATQKIVEYVDEQINAKCVALAGNFDVDKKPSWLNFIEGRGKVVWADAIIEKNIVQSVLKTNSKKIADVVYRKSLLGSISSGSLGFNGHYSNVVAALFIATGQDPAHIVEGSLGVTTAEIEENGDLYFSVYLPSIMAGTVGGGTMLPTQKEALSILGISGSSGGKNSLRFAEIVGAAVLAGELSLTASIAEGSLARTHERFRKFNHLLNC